MTHPNVLGKLILLRVTIELGNLIRMGVRVTVDEFQIGTIHSSEVLQNDQYDKTLQMRTLNIFRNSLLYGFYNNTKNTLNKWSSIPTIQTIPFK